MEFLVLCVLILAPFFLILWWGLKSSSVAPNDSPDMKLAEKGDAKAQFNLGDMYIRGKKVPKDDQLAVKWFRRAAIQGHANAQAGLGVMYQHGKGVPKDYKRAYVLFTLAAAQGDKDHAKLRDDLAKEMDTSQIQEAQRLARNFKPKNESPPPELERIWDESFEQVTSAFTQAADEESYGISPPKTLVLVLFLLQSGSLYGHFIIGPL